MTTKTTPSGLKYHTSSRAYHGQDAMTGEHQFSVHQNIPDSWFTRQQQRRDAAARTLCGDFEPEYSIPVAMAVKWKNDYGFDAFTAEPDDLVAFIRKLPDMEYLACTPKRL